MTRRPTTGGGINFWSVFWGFCAIVDEGGADCAHVKFFGVILMSILLMFSLNGCYISGVVRGLFVRGMKNCVV